MQPATGAVLTNNRRKALRGSALSVGADRSGCTMKHVEILNHDPVFLDLLPHFLGIAHHDNVDAAPSGMTSPLRTPVRRGSLQISILRPRARLDRAILAAIPGR
ncbi:hypothetical protein [Wenxinia marina]|nr:hypothetical protein [Wenxinia marina]